MHRQSRLTFLILIPLILYSCRSSRTVIQPVTGGSGTAAYIEKYADLAVSEMRRTGIPASITLAQGMIESDFGRSRLAREANNHFGIKCHSDWTGPSIRHNDDRRNECFRKYAKPEDSFYDHSDFLVTGTRYASLFSIPSGDYKNWARGLKKAGYATNPDYANMLIRNIEENNLHYYDEGYTSQRSVKKSATVERVEVAEETTEEETSGAEPDKDSLAPEQNLTAAGLSTPEITPRIRENNRIQYIIVKEGETRELLEKAFNLLRWELPRYNELEQDFVPVPGQILYLQPKRDKAEPGKEIHQIAEGETMYSVSQKYGLKLQKLYELNRISKGEEPEAGTKIWLRSFKPVV